MQSKDRYFVQGQSIAYRVTVLRFYSLSSLQIDTSQPFQQESKTEGPTESETERPLSLHA